MPVIEQLRSELPEWQATLLAVDGDIVKSIEDQLRRLPNNATHLVISCGGNDALGQIPYLLSSVSSMEAALSRMASIRETFESDYLVESSHDGAIITIGHNYRRTNHSH